MTFGENLKKIRKMRNLTQTDLCSLTGLSRKTVTNYESGKTYPKKRSTYDILAKALDVDVRELKTETSGFITDAAEKYGSAGRAQAEQIISRAGSLFAGGELSEEDMDSVMMAMQQLYWDAKERNRRKYTPKKFLDKEQ